MRIFLSSLTFLHLNYRLLLSVCELTVKCLDSFSSSALWDSNRTSRWQCFLSSSCVDLLLDSQWFSRVCLCSSALGDGADLWRVQQHTARRTKVNRPVLETHKSPKTYSRVCLQWFLNLRVSLPRSVDFRVATSSWTGQKTHQQDYSEN